MKIIQGCIILTKDDRLTGVELLNCDIHCDFPLQEEGYKKPTETFAIRGHLDGMAEKYKEVFKDCSIIGCVLTDGQPTK